MRTPERKLVVLRAPGGEPWCAEGFSIRDVLTSSVHRRVASTASLASAMRAGNPVAATSPRAANWLAELPASVPRGRIFCSGGRTARILASGGWDAVPPLGGSGGDATARRILMETTGNVLYVCGTETAGSLESGLEDAGREVESLIVYELRDRGNFLEEEISALRSCDAVAVMAPSCLRVLRSVVPDLVDALARSIPALCGPTTGVALREAGWRDVRVAPEPSLSALLPLFESDSVNP